MSNKQDSKLRSLRLTSAGAALIETRLLAMPETLEKFSETIGVARIIVWRLRQNRRASERVLKKVCAGLGLRLADVCEDFDGVEVQELAVEDASRRVNEVLDLIDKLPLSAHSDIIKRVVRRFERRIDKLDPT